MINLIKGECYINGRFNPLEDIVPFLDDVKEPVTDNVNHFKKVFQRFHMLGEYIGVEDKVIHVGNTDFTMKNKEEASKLIAWISKYEYALICYRYLTEYQSKICLHY